jgi:O-antigen ligase
MDYSQAVYREIIEPLALLLLCVSIAAVLVWGSPAVLILCLFVVGFLLRGLMVTDSGTSSAELLMLFLIAGTIGLGRQFSYLGIKIRGMDATLYITEMVLAAACLLVWVRKIITKDRLLTRSPLNFLFLLYYAVGLVCLWRGLPVFGMEAMRHSVVVYYSLFYFLMLELVGDMHHLERFLKYSLLASTLALGVIFYNSIFDIGVMTPQGIKGYGGNIGSLSLTFCFFFWLSLNAFGVRCKARIFLLILIPFQILAVVLGQHRSLLVAIAGGLVFFLVLIGKTRVLKYTSLALCGFLLIFSIVYFSGISSNNSLVRDTLSRASTILTPEEDPNSAHRIAMWDKILDRTSKRPFLGEGFGPPFSVFFGSKFYDYSERRLHPHNSFLWILNRMGIIGFGIFAFLMVRFYNSALKAYRRMRPGKSKAYLLALMSCHICISIFAAFNVVLEGPSMGIFFWVIMGLAMALTKISENELKESTHGY